MPEPTAQTKPADISAAGPAVGTMPAQRDLGSRDSGLSPKDRADMKALFQGNRPDKPATPAPAPAPEPAMTSTQDAAATATTTATREGDAKVSSSPVVLETDKLVLDPTFVPKKAEEWKKLKTDFQSKLDALASERDTFKKQLEGLGDVEALKNLAAERDELRKTLQAVAVERDPTFKAQFEAQRRAYIDEAKATLGENGAEVATILERHGGNSHPLLKEWAAKHEVGAWELQSLLTTVRGLRDLELNRDRMIQESASNWERNVTQQTLAQQRAAEASKRELESAVESRLDFARKGNGLFAKRAEDEAWNGAVEEAIGRARTYALGEHDAESRASVALQAASYPLLVKEYERLATAYREVVNKAAALSGAQPGNGQSSLGEGGATQVDESKMTVGERIVSGMRRAGINPIGR